MTEDEFRGMFEQLTEEQQDAVIHLMEELLALQTDAA